ncbi:MAG TPA: glycosyltransferase [bacterium]|nr:glycosyltransferase [bacterium]HPJ73199.1 glycosyltransferase [bacterium]HPQ67160.1 glycosyltransferase [bacterium]
MKGPVSIILPTYNERENIGPLIQEIARHLYRESEIIVVDDDSPDGTWREVSRIELAAPKLRLLRRMRDHGLTASLRAGIDMARHSTVVWMDADFSHPPSLLPRLLAAPESSDIVLASRYIPGGSDGRRSRLRKAVSVTLNRTAGSLLGCRTRDLSSGYLRVRKSVFKTIPLRGSYGDYCIDFLVRAELAGHSVLEIPFSNTEREHGSSKTTHNPLIFLRYALLYCRTVLRLRYETRCKPGRERPRR